jgi:response regulator RpfG family c-di-GMP phosphodiesterase
MKPNQKTIWVLDPCSKTQSFLKAELGELYALRFFAKFESLAGQSDPPDLLISEAIFNATPAYEFDRPKFLEKTPWMIASDSHSYVLIKSCLDSGIDDFLLKPVQPDLLRAKLARKLEELDRQKLRSELNIQLNPLTLIASDSSVTGIKLTMKEFQILHHLFEVFPKSKSRDAIIRSIWPESKNDSKSFDVHLFKLRKKLFSMDLQVKFEEGNSYRLASQTTRLK